MLPLEFDYTEVKSMQASLVVPYMALGEEKCMAYLQMCKLRMLLIDGSFVSFLFWPKIF